MLIYWIHGQKLGIWRRVSDFRMYLFFSVHLLSINVAIQCYIGNNAYYTFKVKSLKNAVI